MFQIKLLLLKTCTFPHCVSVALLLKWNPRIGHIHVHHVYVYLIVIVKLGHGYFYFFQIVNKNRQLLIFVKFRNSLF